MNKEKEHIIVETVNYLLRKHGDLTAERLNEAFDEVMKVHPNADVKLVEVVSEITMRWVKQTSIRNAEEEAE